MRQNTQSLFLIQRMHTPFGGTHMHRHDPSLTTFAMSSREATEYASSMLARGHMILAVKAQVSVVQWSFSHLC